MLRRLDFLTVINFLFCMSIFTSKSAVTLFGVLLIAFGLIKFPWKQLTQQKWLFAVVLIVPLGFLANLLSLGGLSTGLEYLRAYPWPLLVIPFYLIAKDSQQIKTSVGGYALGALIGVIFSFWQAVQNLGLPADQVQRISGFWDILRWGAFLAVGTLIFVCLPLNTTNRRHQIIFGALSVLTTISLVLSNTRAPWLALVAGLFLLGLTHPKKLKQILVVLVVFIVGLLSNPELQSRFASIFSVELKSGHVTSSNLSNAGRLHMWKVNSDYLKQAPWWRGTGYDNTEPFLKEFVSKQSLEYQQKYIIQTFSFRDQHSSYLSSLVQFGPAFALYFWLVMIGLALASFRSALSGEFSAKVLTSALVAYFVIFFFYSAYNSYEMIPLYALIGLIAGLNQSRGFNISMVPKQLK